MKTIKKVILLGAVAFSAALNVQAYFDPTTGRWASRDPIQEDGGINLYSFNGNDALNNVDQLGEKIISLEIHQGGKAELDDSVYTDLASGIDYSEYIQAIIGGDLGYRQKFIPKHTQPWFNGYRQTTVDRPARTVAGFKFEYVVQRTCVGKDYQKDFKITQTVVNKYFFKRKNNGPWRIVSLDDGADPRTPPFGDGPTLVKFFPDLPNVKVVAGDMPRFPIDKGDKWEYRMGITWKVRAEDADNAWEGEHHIMMDFNEANGNGVGQIFEAPKEVSK